MTIEIREVGSNSIGQYGQIPMRHRVDSVFRVDEIDGGLGGLTLTETPFDQPRYLHRRELCACSFAAINR